MSAPLPPTLIGSETPSIRLTPDGPPEHVSEQSQLGRYPVVSQLGAKADKPHRTAVESCLRKLGAR